MQSVLPLSSRNHLQLNPNSGRGALTVRWRAQEGFYVENVFTIQCMSYDDMLAVLEEGLQNRRTASHLMNERSSRSHSLLTVNVEGVSASDDSPEAHPIRRMGKMIFVDLAVRSTSGFNELSLQLKNS